MEISKAIELFKKMNDEQILKNKKPLEKLLEKASSAYYNTDSKIMSDTDFDLLKDMYERVIGDFKVGAPALEGKGTVDVEHSFAHLVGTLSKTNSIEGFKEWLTKTVKNAGLKPKDKISVMASYKYDGNSVVIEFRNGKSLRHLHVDVMEKD